MEYVADCPRVRGASIMLSHTDPPEIPTTLAVLRLPYPHIVHPGLVLSVTLPQKQCFRILRTALADRRGRVQA